MKHPYHFHLSTLGLLLLCGSTVDAAFQGPPAEALEACASQSEGNPCNFSAPHGMVSGSCLNTHGGIACVPERGPVQNQGRSSGERRGGPPAEAFSACDGLASGDACTVQTPHGNLQGRCRSHGGDAFCVPDHHRQGPVGK